MGEIVDLASERGHRAGRESASENAHGPAQIVLYTGVRYERHDEPPAPASTPKSKRRRKPKNS